MPASSFVLRDHGGAAVDTTITADITGSSLSITIASSTGWPAGGASGPFIVIVDYDVAGKEKIEVQSRTGTTLTVADTGKRGIDGTGAASHTSGAKIRHCNSALEASEWSNHIATTGMDHHSQYLNTTRHAAVVHTSGMLGVDSVTSTQIAADAVGASELANNAVDTAAIVDGAVTAAKIAADTITAGQVAPNAIGASELADNAVDSAAIAAAAVVAGKIAAGGVSATNQIADAIVTLAKLASEAPSTWTVTFANVTLGTGGTTWRGYYKLGRLVIGFCGFALGTSGADVTGDLSFNLPVLPFDLTGGAFSGLNTGGVVLLRGSQAAVNVWHALGRIDSSGTAGHWVTTGTNTDYGATTPFNWGNNDHAEFLFVYVATA